MNNRLLWENGLKNVITVILLSAVYGPTEDFLASLTISAIDYQTIITLASLLIMAFLFASYTFTFKYARLEHRGERFLDYLYTGIVMFGCGALLEIAYITITLQLNTPFFIMGGLMILFYVSLVLFDFLDLMRAMARHE